MAVQAVAQPATGAEALRTYGLQAGRRCSGQLAPGLGLHRTAGWQLWCLWQTGPSCHGSEARGSNTGTARRAGQPGARTVLRHGPLLRIVPPLAPSDPNHT